MLCRFRFSAFFLLLPLLVLSGCYDPIEDLKPTSFKARDLEKSSQGRIVEIIAIMPATAEVDNFYNHYRAVNVASLTMGSLFSLTGIGLGMDGMALGWYLGASIGESLGSAIAPPALYPKSLILSYKDPLEPQIHQVIEIARPCEFTLGHAYAVLIENHKKLEMKIQPNHFQACLERAKSLKEDQKEGVRYQLTSDDLFEEIRFSDSLLPPVGTPTILKLSDPAYHSPYRYREKIQKAKKQTGLTAKQRRLLRRHKTLQAEKMPFVEGDISSHPIYAPQTQTGSEQWQRLNRFGEGF